MEEEINNNLNSENQLYTNKGEVDSNIKELKQLVNNLGLNIINVNRLDYYSNTIPIGAFCNAVAFILYGFKLCHVFSGGIFLQGVLLIFGGIGQITTGVLEYLKARTFPCSIYFTYGLFCLSLFIIESDIFEWNKIIGTTNKELCAFYGAWMIISIPITISSIKVNFFYILHTFLTTAFFVIEVIGEGFKEDKAKENAAGVIMTISGFISLYIFLTQIINEAVKFPLLPSVPVKPDNEVDITQDYRGDFTSSQIQ